MLLRLFIIALIVTASGCVSELFSETVKLINGNAIIGDLVKVADETVSVESKGEEVVIRKDRIQSIVFQSDVDDVDTSKVVLASTNVVQSNANKLKHYAIGFEVAQDADPKLNPSGVSLYIQHVWNSGIGVQANLGSYIADFREGYKTTDIQHTFPVILQYHFFKGSVLDSYAGIGVCRSLYTSDKWVGGWDWEWKVKKGFSPLANIGFAFGADSPLQVVVNMKYFISLYSSKANMITGGVGVSINW